ncbi:MAG: PUR family DNA/RNA-binding protein [Bacteroidales bacterium]|nr:PUR family DNA/RNA-binding protein [Bacteroidales bacterium]
MYFEDYENAKSQERSSDDVYSKPVRAGKRTYFFDVKATKGNDYYLTITESKRKIERDGKYVYDKHKIFLYKEDFEKFSEGLQEVIDYIKERCPVVEARPYADRPSAEADGNQPAGSYSDVDFDEL